MHRRNRQACPCAGQECPSAAEPRVSCWRWSIPFQRSLLPFIDEADGQNAKEHHHRCKAEPADFTKGHGPWEKEGDFQIEDDEENRHQIETDVELHTGVIEGIEAALVSGKLFRVGLSVSDKKRRNQEGYTNYHRDAEEDDDRQVGT